MLYYWWYGLHATQAFWLMQLAWLTDTWTRSANLAADVAAAPSPDEAVARVQRWVRAEMHALPVLSSEARAALAEAERVLKADR